MSFDVASAAASPSAPAPSLRTRRNAVVAIALFVVTIAIFRISPVEQLRDSQYSSLMSDAILHGNVDLDDYRLPRAPIRRHRDRVEIGNYRLELDRGHVYYYFPPGSPALSAPWVALWKAFGVSPVAADGSYDLGNDVRIQRSLAELLMAIFTVLVFALALLFVPTWWAAAIALTVALGSQVWSTASRALWSDTWGLVLVGTAVLLVAGHDRRGWRLRPVILGSLAAWSYIVRPSYAVVILALAGYVAVAARRHLLAYVVGAGMWLAAFVAYSQLLFGHPLPGYYFASRLQLTGLPDALPGHLFSPSRGLFVFVPTLLFVAWLLVRHRATIPSRRLLVLALFIVATHLLLISSLKIWWVGNYYGARLSTGLVPWFALLAVLAATAYRQRIAREASGRGAVLLGFGAVTVAVSVAMNGTGAIAQSTVTWYDDPVPFEKEAPGRVWDWRYPQFLAPVTGIAPPRPIRVARSQVPIGSLRGDPFVWYGWSRPETSSRGVAFRWTKSTRAGVIFETETPLQAIEMEMVPFVRTGHPRQRVDVRVNGHRAASWVLTDGADFRTYRVEVPPAARRMGRTEITFSLPDARDPASLDLTYDPRLLALAVHEMRLIEDG